MVGKMCSTRVVTFSAFNGRKCLGSIWCTRLFMAADRVCSHGELHFTYVRASGSKQ